jgi:Protein of unknown function VcgC/VcgE (DUF2780)
MDDILRELSSRLGIPLDQAQSGAGAVLDFIRENASQVDFQQLLKSVPEAAAWMGKATADGTSDSGGLFGQITGLLGSFGGSAAGILTVLSRSGLSPETAARFVPELLGLLQGKAGGDLIGRLAGSIPFLGEFLGGRQS